MSTIQRIQPIPVYTTRLARLNELFNICIRDGLMDNWEYSPAIKLGFIGNGNHYLDRMFTIEERNGMLFFVKNVIFGDDMNEYRRSVYVIPKSKVMYVHYFTGIIFQDLFDYLHIEPSPMLNFYYGEKYYDTIKEISDQDPVGYKLSTRIFIKQPDTNQGFNNQNTLNVIELQNDIQMFTTFYNKDLQLKIGYYIPDSSIQFYHTIEFLPRKFGLVQYPSYYFSEIDKSAEGMFILANNLFLDPRSGPVKLTKNGKVAKQTVKNPYIGVSLFNKLQEAKNKQQRRIILGWFICEIMYSYIFADAL